METSNRLLSTAVSVILLQIVTVISAGKILVLVDNLNIRETHSIFLKSLKGKQQLIYSNRLPGFCNK